MNSEKTALVLGASGGVGGAIAAALIRAGWSVKALARDPRKAGDGWAYDVPAPQWVQGDAMNAGQVRDAASGVRLIVHAVNPPRYLNWETTVLPMMANTLAAARAAGGARVVLPGTIYNYDPTQVSVAAPDTPQQPTSRKGKIRVELERMLERAAAEVPSLIVRAGDFYGPGAHTSWFTQALVRPGRPVRYLLDPAAGPGHSWAYLPDLAAAIVRLVEAEDSLAAFERVHFEGYYDADGHGMVEALHRVLGRKPLRGRFPWWLMRALSPLGGFPREAAEIGPYWRHPLRLDNRRLLELLGAEPRTPLQASVGETLSALGCLDASSQWKTA